ncbi:type II toxin-antitoxin system PemK/MazF family toxin [candidate division WOR-3 bacterium]|nr:type II toxin-antitoxin system PemK/MazF family toxin [candidate division WOR-3 bacterium]
MKYKKGDIVVVKFPFLITNGVKIQKGRPALILSSYNIIHRYNDYILAAITSHIPNDIMDLELILEKSKQSGLVKKSLLRLDFIMTIPEELINRKIGYLNKVQIKTINQKLQISFDI